MCSTSNLLLQHPHITTVFLQGDNDDNRNAVNLTQFALQPQPGVYNETIFRAIDRVLAAADVAGLKVLVVQRVTQAPVVNGSAAGCCIYYSGMSYSMTAESTYVMVPGHRHTH
jgi:hypothetical protein